MRAGGEQRERTLSKRRAAQASLRPRSRCTGPPARRRRSRRKPGPRCMAAPRRSRGRRLNTFPGLCYGKSWDGSGESSQCPPASDRPSSQNGGGRIVMDGKHHPTDESMEQLTGRLCRALAEIASFSKEDAEKVILKLLRTLNRH